MFTCLHISRAQCHNNSIFGEIEILISKWSWQHQLLQCNKILIPYRVIFTQYTNVRLLNLATSLLYCTDALSRLNSRTSSLCFHRLLRGSFVFRARSYDNVAFYYLQLFLAFSQIGYFGVKMLWHWALDLFIEPLLGLLYPVLPWPCQAAASVRQAAT